MSLYLYISISLYLYISISLYLYIYECSKQLNEYMHEIDLKLEGNNQNDKIVNDLEYYVSQHIICIQYK